MASPIPASGYLGLILVREPSKILTRSSFFCVLRESPADWILSADLADPILPSLFTDW